jgi:hypothetical protein
MMKSPFLSWYFDTKDHKLNSQVITGFMKLPRIGSDIYLSKNLKIAVVTLTLKTHHDEKFLPVLVF